MSSSSFCSLIWYSAFASAVLTTLSSIAPPRFFENLRTSSARLIGSPRIWSPTRRTFSAPIRAKRCFASKIFPRFASFSARWASLRLLWFAIDRLLLLPARPCRRRRGGPGRLLRGVAAEGPRRRELAELVAHHVFDHEDLEELVAVVDHERVPDHLGRDRRGASPRLDPVAVVRLLLLHDLRHELRVDERALPD